MYLTQSLQDIGCQHLLIQSGSTDIPDEDVSATSEEYGINIECYSYKSSILRDIEWADLIIGHAGAGTTIEVLRSNKVFITVINSSLMNNHQTELADALYQDGYLIKCLPETLEDALEKVSFPDFTLTPFPPQDPSRFRNFLESNVFEK